VSEDISLNGRLLVSGNVGIGLTNPNYALDVSSASNPFRVGAGTNDNALVVSSAGRVGIGSGSPGYALDVTSATGLPLRVGAGTYNTNALVINNQGLVGVGLTNPNYALDVSSASNPFRVGVPGTNNNVLVVSSDGKVGIGSSTPAVALDVAGVIQVSSNSNNYVVLNNGIPALKRGIAMRFNGTGISSDYGEIWAEHQGTAYRNLVLNTNGGYVGIGSTNPGYPLDVSGSIRTNGIAFNSSNLTTPIKIVTGTVSFSSTINAGAVTNSLAKSFGYTFSSIPTVIGSCTSGINGECLSMMFTGITTTSFDLYVKNNSSGTNVTVPSGSSIIISYVAIGAA